MRRIGGLWHRIWPVVVLALLCGVFFWDVLWLPGSRIVAGNDLINIFYHWLRCSKSCQAIEP